MSKLLNQEKLYNREARINTIYTWILCENDSSEFKMDDSPKFSLEQIEFIKSIYEEIDMLEKKIIEHIPSSWKWERFNYLEKAILINATAEILLAKNKKSIVIDESLEYAKVFCGEKSQPLINAIIDKI